MVETKIQCFNSSEFLGQKETFITALQFLLPELQNGFIYDAVLFSSKVASSATGLDSAVHDTQAAECNTPQKF